MKRSQSNQRSKTVLTARGETKFPGIKRHAETLGVSRPHLFLVLTGKRKSNSLLVRYNNLLRQEGRQLIAA